MAKRTPRSETAAPDDLTIERVERWLKERVARLPQMMEQRHGPSASQPPRLVLSVQLRDRLSGEIDALVSRIRDAEEIERLSHELARRFATFERQNGAERPPTTPPTPPSDTQHRSDRWRKRPLSEKERDDLRLELLRARAAGSEAFARSKRALAERLGLSPGGVNATLGFQHLRRRSFAVEFAARVINRAPGTNRQAHLVVELSNLLGLKQNAIMRAVREVGNG
ncbi:hypothetical protein HY635_00915 [Candidatus Uhrbacteria bacterium]|nr:hypothetical protein [Candidatus Uhrbacteria bacterium]